MNALPNLRCQADADEETIEAMLIDQDTFAEFIKAYPWKADALRLLFEFGLPRMDESETDDILRDLLELRMDGFRKDFAEWAYTMAKWPVNCGMTNIELWRYRS